MSGVEGDGPERKGMRCRSEGMGGVAVPSGCSGRFSDEGACQQEPARGAGKPAMLTAGEGGLIFDRDACDRVLLEM